MAQACMDSDSGYILPALIGTESGGDFVDTSSAESIAVSDDSRYIAIGFTHSDTTIVGAGTNPKAVALLDTSIQKWLFVKGIDNQHPDYTCQVYFTANQDHVLASYSYKTGTNVYPAFALYDFTGASDGDIKLYISDISNRNALYKLQPSGVVTNSNNDIYVAINYTINETVPGGNVDGNRRMALCMLHWIAGAPPSLVKCVYYQVQSDWSFVKDLGTSLFYFQHPDPDFTTRAGLTRERVFACLQGTDSNSSVFHWSSSLLEPTMVYAGDITQQLRYATQVQVMAIDPSNVIGTQFLVFKFLHKYKAADAHTEWQIQLLNNDLTQNGAADYIKQRTDKFKFKYFAARMMTTDIWYAVGFDQLTSKTFFIKGVLSDWRVTVYEFPNASQTIRAAVILGSGRVFYAGHASKIETYDYINSSPFPVVSSYRQLAPASGTFSTTVAQFSEYSNTVDHQTNIRFKPMPVFDCNTACSGLDKIITGDNAGAYWVFNVATDIVLISENAGLSASTMAAPGSWVSSQTRDWRKVKDSTMQFTLTAPLFDADDLFYVILEQPSPLAFQDWSLSSATFATCADAVSSFVYQVTPADDLNSSLSRNLAGNTLIWDKINEVPIATNPNVLSMSSSNQSILSNSYSVEVFVQFKNYQTAQKTFTVKVKQACRFTSFSVAWDSNSLTSLAQSYILGSGAVAYSYTITKDQSWCDFEQVLQIFDGTSWIASTSIDVLLGLLNLQINTSDSNLDVGAFDNSSKFRILIGTPSLATSNSQKSLTIDILWRNPCRYETIAHFTMPDQTISVLQGPQTMLVPALSHGLTGSPLFDCGPFSFQYYSTPVFKGVQSTNASTGALTIEARLNEQVGEYKLQLRVWLQNFQLVTFTTPQFMITVKVCKVTSLTPKDGPKTLDYIIALDKKFITFKDFEQVPKCGYLQTYSLVDANTKEPLDGSKGIILSTNSIQPRTVMIQTSNKSLGGTHKVNVIATAQDFVSPVPFQLTVNMFALPNLQNNAPKFTEVPPGSVFPFILGVTERLNLPTVFDQDGNLVKVEVNLMIASLYFKFNEESLQIEPLPDITRKSIGFYPFSVVLTDDNKDDPRSRTYFFSIEIQADSIDTDTSTTFAGFIPYVPDIDAPVPKITDIDEHGQVTIEWSKPLDRVYSAFNQTSLAELSEIMRNETAIKIRVQQNEFQDYKDMLGLTWEFIQVKKIDAKKMTIKLSFDHPEVISSQDPSDKLEIIFLNETWFNDTTGQRVTRDTLIVHKLPPILAQTTAAATLSTIGSVVSTAVTSSAGVAVILNWIFGTSLNMVWSMVNSLQIVTHFPMLKIIFPSNVLSIFGFFIKIATFDLIPTQSTILRIFQIDEDEGAFNEELERLEYTFLSVFANMSTTFIVWVLLVTGMAAHGLIKVLARISPSPRLEKAQNWLYEYIYIDFIMLFIVEGSLEASICSFIDIDSFLISFRDSPETQARMMQAARWQTSIGWLGFIFSSIMVGLFGFYISQLIFYLWPNFSKFQNEEEGFARHWRLPLEDVRLKYPSYMLYTVFFVGRRIILGILGIWGQYFWLQCIIQFYVSMTVIVFIGHARPMATPGRNRIEMFNDIFIVISMYHFFVFTEFVPKPQNRYYLGYSCCICVLLNILGNLGLLLFDTFSKVTFQIKYRRLKKKLSKDLGLLLTKFIPKQEQEKAEEQPPAPQLISAVTRHNLIPVSGKLIPEDSTFDKAPTLHKPDLSGILNDKMFSRNQSRNFSHTAVGRGYSEQTIQLVTPRLLRPKDAASLLDEEPPRDAGPLLDEEPFQAKSMIQEDHNSVYVESVISIKKELDDISDLEEPPKATFPIYPWASKLASDLTSEQLYQKDIKKYGKVDILSFEPSLPPHPDIHPMDYLNWMSEKSRNQKKQEELDKQFKQLMAVQAAQQHTQKPSRAQTQRESERPSHRREQGSRDFFIQ